MHREREHKHTDEGTCVPTYVGTCVPTYVGTCVPTYTTKAKKASALDGGRKGKGHPCTGTEALYRPYGP